MLQLNNKKIYVKPEIQCFELDNEISLALESFGGNPQEPGVTQLSPEFLKNDPYKILT